MAKKLQTLLNAAVAGIYPALEAMTDAELRRVRGCREKLSKTNCWWLPYRLAPQLADIADSILQTRFSVRRKANRAEKAKVLKGPTP